MKFEMIDLLRLPLATLTGVVIGWAFGLVQNAARRRHQRLQQEGKYEGGGLVAPGSYSRVAYLLVALVVVQLVCPLLFDAGSRAPWYVSGGLVVGYGWTLFRQLQQRRA
jgi:hypothetical protein